MASPSPTPKTHTSTAPTRYAITFHAETACPDPTAAQRAATAPLMACSPFAPSLPLPPFAALLAVASIVREFRALGHLASLDIPVAVLSKEPASASDVFDLVLAAFLGEALGSDVQRPVPPGLADRRPVQLLRLYLAVRAVGGFAAVASWAAMAEAAGLDADVATSVKLVYAAYLAVLEQRIHKPGEGKEDVTSKCIAGLHLGTKKGRFLSPTKDYVDKDRSLSPTKDYVNVDAGSPHLKRKRDVVVDVLNWMRNAAKSLNVVTRSPNDHLSHALLLRHQMFVNLNIINLACWSGTAESDWDGQPKKKLGLAKVPEWTGKPSVPSDDPDMLRYLGTPILPPIKEESLALDLDAGAIGKGRPDECKCQFPASIDCVRFHVVEEKLKLKHELGSAFYAMGFDRMGEDIALTWTKDEGEKFNAIVKRNLPSSKHNFWEKLYPAFPSKGMACLVNYYYNVFQLRRRAYQNRLAPNAVHSDDDSIERGFLKSHRRDGGQGSSGSVALARIQKRGA